MRRTLHILLICLLFISSVSLADPPQPTPQSFAIAAYNVRNLFDRYDNPYTKDESTKPKPERELTALASAIRKVNADVMILEEIEAGGALTAFAREHLTDYPYIIENPTTDPRGASIGVISKIPIMQIVSHRLMPLDPAGPNIATNHFARDLLRIDLEPHPGLKLSLYGVHLKSKRDTEGDPKSAKWRLAEAKKIAEILKDDYASGIKNFAILGDFNDTADSPALTAITTALGEPKLTDAHAHIPADQRITFENSRFREAIDFILISPDLARKILPQSGTIYQGDPFTIASDHRPIKVIIDLSK